MTRPRKVFGRVRVEILEGGATRQWRFEMTREGLYARAKSSRKKLFLPFHALADLARGQMVMHL